MKLAEKIVHGNFLIRKVLHAYPFKSILKKQYFTKTKPMTNEQRMRCIMVYPTAPIKYGNEICDLINIGYVEDRLYLLGKNSKKAYDVSVSEVQIVLRPVSSMTDEECIEVARIITDIEQYHTAKQGRYFIDKIYFSLPHSEIIKYYDYLRTINVITTVHGFDLVAEGVAIVHSEKKGL